MNFLESKRNAHDKESGNEYENDPARKIEQSIYELGSKVQLIINIIILNHTLRLNKELLQRKSMKLHN